jgi:hypothetical protein
LGPYLPPPSGATGMAEQEQPSNVAQHLIIKFLMKEGVIPPEIFTRLQAWFGDVCHSQECSVGRNHFEKDKTMLKMNLMLGDEELLSIQTML